MLNYHHLHYFSTVAHEGNLTRAARRLHVSQSAVSTQIKLLEEQLGQPLFHRVGRRLELSEAGVLALGYAEQIFRIGDELVATLASGRRAQAPLRVAALATLSRNFQDSFLAPLRTQPTGHFVIRIGRLEELLAELCAHNLDLILTNRPVHGDARVYCRRLARQEVSLVGPPREQPFRYPEDLDGQRLILPSSESDIRSNFDVICHELALSTHVAVEVDDMAMMRLLAREAGLVALLPSVVVRDELRSGILEEYAVVPELFESFFAVTARRTFPHPLVATLLARNEADFLNMAASVP